MKLHILQRTNAKDPQGNLREAYDAVTEDGEGWWLIPSSRNRMTHGPLNLKPHDVVVVDGNVRCQYPILRADIIEKAELELEFETVH
jgi:hypothetical protein